MVSSECWRSNGFVGIGESGRRKGCGSREEGNDVGLRQEREEHEGVEMGNAREVKLGFRYFEIDLYFEFLYGFSFFVDLESLNLRIAIGIGIERRELEEAKYYALRVEVANLKRREEEEEEEKWRFEYRVS